MLIMATGLTIGIHNALRLTPAQTAGLFAGSLTNTPALASVLDYIQNYATPTNSLLLTEPVVGYSLTYPVGVIGMILAISLVERLWKVDYAREAQSLPESQMGKALQNRTVRVTRPEAIGATIGELIHRFAWDVVFGRVQHHDHLSLVSSGQSRFEVGDLVSVIGTREELDRVTAYLGETSEEQLAFDRSELDYCRIFVSNTRVVGHRLRDPNLPQHFGALVTRLRRVDVDFLPHTDTVLQLGDRVRVVAPRDHMDAVSDFFGD